MASLTKVRIPSGRERAISFGVLLVLGIVLAGVWRQQSRFNPAVTVAALAAKQAGAPAMATPAAAAQDLLEPWPAAVRKMSAAEAFDEATLSDKIDGKAELYLSAGFVAMRCQRVALATAADSWVEAFVFDMGKPASAYSVFSSQKRPEAPDAGVADYSYLADNQLCFVHGKYYVELVAADAKAATLAAARELALALIAAHPVEERADVSREQALFPPQDLVAGSVSLLSADVFGFIELKDVYAARYREDGDEVTLFVARRASPADAAWIAAAFRAYLVQKCGGKELPPSAAVPDAAFVDLDGSCDSVFVSGSLMAGVHQAPNRDAAERLAARLQQHIRGKSP